MLIPLYYTIFSGNRLAITRARSRCFSGVSCYNRPGLAGQHGLPNRNKPAKVMTASSVPLVAAAGFGLLLGLLIYYRERWQVAEYWLAGFAVSSIVLCALAALIHWLPANPWVRHGAAFAWAVGLVCLGYLTLEFANGTRKHWMAAVAAICLAALAGLDWFAFENTVVSSAADRLFHFPRLDVSGVIFLPSWMATAIGLVILTLYSSARDRLPLHANRLLYWAGALCLVFAGQFLFALRSVMGSIVGAMLQLAGSAGMLYGIVSHHVFDVRGSARRALGFAISTLLTAIVIMGGMLVAPEILEQFSGIGVIPLIVTLALILGTIFQLANRWVDRFISRVVMREGYDAAVIVETYSRAIGNILDIETLTTIAIGTISEYLEIRRGGVMLVTQENGRIRVQPVRGMGRVPEVAMVFPADDPIFGHLVKKRQPLLQYDIDVLPAFTSLSQEQRQWLARLQTDVYVPIMTDGLPIGLFALGPKGTGEPYRPEELQLLQTLAGQTVVALTNARLFADMKSLNEEIQILNQNLRRSNERLQHMDQVKSDFITIASHELRTPLTQIKGYAEILGAMVEDGSLEMDEGQRLIGFIGGATDQLESVIGAMLDVSQIDVDAMSLNLSQANLDTVLRIAIEPLANAMRERRLTLTVRGIRNLPPIVADFQRMAQVVSNLIYNAVKYTPDGGRISISADVLKDEHGLEKEIELVLADTGVGVDPRDHELIFEKFFRAADPQLHSTGSTKFMGAGPGLGLSIVRGIVEAHGGRIWVESEGHDPVRCPGSRFHVILPLRPEKYPDEQDAPEPPADAEFQFALP